MAVSIKICGLTDEASVQAVAKAKADYAGFVHFARSPRHLTLEKAGELKKKLPDSVQSVMVLVDPDDSLLDQVEKLVTPNYLQLHGKETPERVKLIRSRFSNCKIIKAVPIKSGDDVAQALRYADAADMLLFDARAPELPGMLPGGNGLSFDWALLKGRDFHLPWMLSGGLTPDNVAEAIRSSGAAMVDVSSGVESTPGVKDAALIQQFVQAARSV